MKTNADYLPLIDMTPSDPDTITNILSKANVLTQNTVRVALSDLVTVV